MSNMPPLSRSYQNYTIGWICAIESELVAAIAMLDETHDVKLPAVDGDSNNYKFGRIGRHNVVIASLPSGNYGTNPAAVVAGQMKRTFGSLRFGLLVGIGGGVPRLTDNNPADIRLGDVIVSEPTEHVGGVFQYDRGRTKEGEERPERTGTLNKPPESLLTAVLGLKTNHKLTNHPLRDHLAQMIQKYPHLDLEYTDQGEENDILFEAGYKHEGPDTDCGECLKSRSVSRPHRQSPHPQIHYGTIASGNQVVKDSVTRDYWRDKEHVLCFEMEAAGLMDSFPCLVIRGICDYADSHKNKRWQPYAAATAAAYARDLLLEIAPSAVDATDLLSGGQPESGNVHWMVPRNTNTLFTGRRDILEKLDRSLGPHCDSSHTGEQQKRFVIIGDGGIGKSEVCLKFVNDHRNNFWGIFWIDASSEATAKQAFLDVGKRCGTNAGSFEQVKTWLANIPHSWLLIIDNADNPKFDYAAIFPSGNRGNIILTTRNPHCRDHATVGSEDLDHLSFQDALSLFLKSAGMTEIVHGDNPKAGENVVQALGLHTLAIIQAGAYIKLRFCSLEEYPTILKQQEERLMKFHQEQAQSVYGSVFATFEVSATHLKESAQDQSTAEALNLLHILGFLHLQDIPESMFTRAREDVIAIHEHINRVGPLDEIHQLSQRQTSRLPNFMMQENDTAMDSFLWRLRKALDLLESYSLIKITISGESLSFSMHPLVHTWTRIRHDLVIQETGWKAAGCIIALSMHGSEYNVFLEKLRSHVVAYLNYLSSESLVTMTDLEICQTHYKVSWLLVHLNEGPKCRSLLDMLETSEAWAGARARSDLQVQVLTASCFDEEGRPHEAVELLEQLMCMGHADAPEVQQVLTMAYVHSNQHQKAIVLLEQIVGSEGSTERVEAGDSLWVKFQLGLAYVPDGQFEKAVRLLEQIVQIDAETMEPADRSRLACEYSLGSAYLGTDQFEKAAKILEHVLEIQRTVLDVTDRMLLVVQFQLASAYIGMGSGFYEKAAELLELVVERGGRTLGCNDYIRLASQYNLAFVYSGMESGHYEKAAELLEKVIENQEKTSAPDRPTLLESRQLLETVQKRIEPEEDAE